jgi:rare lipoprotein A
MAGQRYDRTMRRLALFFVCAALILAGCGRKKPRGATPPPAPASRTPAVPPPPVGSTERGVASWYGKPYDGRPAADGEIYDMEQMVAAHRTLPFQTMVRVRNLSNGKTVDVRIIDRGPFVNNRIIDLSHAAARAIELIGPGVANVELTILSTPASTIPAQFAVQVGAFRERANADRMQQRMTTTYGSAKLVVRQGDPPLWRVLAGSEPSPEAAETLARRIRQEQDLSFAFVVRLDP